MVVARMRMSTRIGRLSPTLSNSFSSITRRSVFCRFSETSQYFLPEELDALASQDGFDQEKDIAEWEELIADLKALTAKGDPASPASQALARRWLAQTEKFTRGDQILSTKLRNMTKDAMADPVTAAEMPYEKKHLMFLGAIFESMTS